MALRLTTTSLAAAQHAAAGTAPAGSDEALGALAARAATALLSRRFDDYRASFAETAEIADPVRRYYARKLLIEQGFATCDQATTARAHEILLATATAAIDALDVEPAEPVLLNYAGVAMYELWSLDAATALFKAAQRLDPSLANVARNLAACKHRKHVGGRNVSPLRGVTAKLVRRARSVAERAVPAKDMTLSLCMIVRDEAEMLPRCLAAAAPAVDEIVIVDTGSRDNTIEIARSFGAKVIEREWTGSFSDARNASFEAATGDWLLYLDADEVLVAGDVPRLRALTGQSWRECFFLAETNYFGEEEHGTAVSFSALRMFRNRPHYRFSGRLHEQISQHMPGYLPERILYSDVRIEHFGYLGVVRDTKDKKQRNIELLLAQRSDRDEDPFLHFNLGSEYFAAGDSATALAEYQQAWDMLKAIGPSTKGYTPILLSRMTKALTACQRPEDAIALADEGLALYPEYTDLVYEQGSAAATMGRLDDAAEYFRTCISMGDAPAPFTALVGCGTYLPRIALARMHMRAGENDAAVDLLRWCAAQHPEFFGTILPYADALLRTGSGSEAVLAEIESCVPAMTPTVRFRIGVALYEAGHAQAAEQQFRLVLGSKPHNGPARVALGEVLLRQRRYQEAAAEAALIDRDSPLAPIAARSEIFATILAEDYDGARAVLSGCADVGMPAAEVALFRSWLGQRTGELAPTYVPPSAWNLLGLMLDSLLRVQDFTSFETLLPVLAASGMPVRERRELLGCIYLRRGFLRSAAREWLAVVDEQPDARALLGLAQVAVAHGQPASARTFASHAVALDPGCVAASSILEALARSDAARVAS